MEVLSKPFSCCEPAVSSTAYSQCGWYSAWAVNFDRRVPQCRRSGQNISISSATHPGSSVLSIFQATCGEDSPTLGFPLSFGAEPCRSIMWVLQRLLPTGMRLRSGPWLKVLF